MLNLQPDPDDVEQEKREGGSLYRYLHERHVVNAKRVKFDFDAGTGVEQQSVEVVIDRAFSDDF